MAEYNPDDLIGRTFLLPPSQNGERCRACIKQKVLEVSHKLDEDQETLVSQSSAEDIFQVAVSY